MQSRQLPRALRPGDRIGIVAPAGVVSREALERGLAEVRSWGLDPVLGDHVFDQRGYLAGDDAARAADLNRFFRDPSIAGILCARGGYGSLRILPLIDMDAVRRHPKVFVGFSDITTLHLAFWKEAGLVTFHGPMGEVHDPSGQMPPYNAACLKAAIFGQAFPGPVPWPDAPDAPEPVTVVPGTARGRLIGGNLELVSRLSGTPWHPDTRGSILVLEEVDEEPYRCDRMLTHLRLAGVLDGVAGVLFGHSPTCERPRTDRPSLHLLEVLHDHLAPLGVPVLYGFPCGHSRYRTTLPLGVQAELDATAGTLTILEAATV